MLAGIFSSLSVYRQPSLLPGSQRQPPAGDPCTRCVILVVGASCDLVVGKCFAKVWFLSYAPADTQAHLPMGHTGPGVSSCCFSLSTWPCGMHLLILSTKAGHDYLPSILKMLSAFKKYNKLPSGLGKG